MAQTGNAISIVDADLELSTNGTAWTNFAGVATALEVPEQARMTAPAYTFEGDVAIIGQGKREPMAIVLRYLYTEDAAELFEFLRPLFQAGTKVYLRYAPKGLGATGRAVYTASNDGSVAGAVSISQFKYPEGSADSADPVPCFAEFMVPALVRTTTGNSTGLGSA